MSGERFFLDPTDEDLDLFGLGWGRSWDRQEKSGRHCQEKRAHGVPPRKMRSKVSRWGDCRFGGGKGKLAACFCIASSPATAVACTSGMSSGNFRRMAAAESGVTRLANRFGAGL